MNSIDPGLLKMKSVEVEEGLEILQLDSAKMDKFDFTVDKRTIVFAYSTDSSCGIEWPDHHQTHVLEPVRILVYSYPIRETTMRLTMPENSTTFLLKISIGRLHQFFGSNFGDNPDEIQSFVGTFRIKNVYSEKAVNPGVSVIFHQMLNHNMEGAMAKLYLHSKVTEFLSIYMQQSKPDQAFSLQCSFMNDHFEMEKIKEARDLIVKDLTSPPNLKDLAHSVGTNEFKLKVGFKSLFGNTVYGYLNEYRMEKARHLLEKRSYSVKEISHIIGYSNPSYFIAAYKKKFGITPKKYLMSLH